MKRLIGIFATLAFLGTLADARIINPNTGINYSASANADIVCFGGRVISTNPPSVKSATEVCIDANGDIVPTANGANINLGSASLGTAPYQSLGSQAFPWGLNYFGTQVFISGMASNTTTGSAVVGTSPFTVGSSCGLGGLNMITGTDFAGILTLGTGTSAACTMGFNPVFLNTPICMTQIITGPFTTVGNNWGDSYPIVLPTSIQFGTSLGPPGKIDYICVGQTQ
jgi:hypothetical protein